MLNSLRIKSVCLGPQYSCYSLIHFLPLFQIDIKEYPMTDDWANRMSPVPCFGDEIDEVMKHEHEDAILINDLLSLTLPNFDLDSMPNSLENHFIRTSNFNQLLNINDLSSTSTTITNHNHNSLPNNTVSSVYSTSDISPRFTTLSINKFCFTIIFDQSNNTHTSRNSSTTTRKFHCR